VAVAQGPFPARSGGPPRRTLCAARYALQIVARCPFAHPRLHDDDFLGALWALTLPLVEPARLVQLQADWLRPDRESELDDEEERPFRRRMRRGTEESPLLDGVPGARMREFLIAHFTAIPERLLAQLVQADGHRPTHPSVTVLAHCAGLDEIECRILDFVEKKEAVPYFRTFLREAGCDSSRDNYACLSAALDVRTLELQSRLFRRNPLALLALVKKANRRANLEDVLQSEDLFDDILTLEPTTSAALLAALIEPAGAAECALADFPHLAPEAARLSAVLGKAAATLAPGVNALLYGPPGSGKTEFAHVLADALDRELVVMASSDLVSPYVGEPERNLARLFADIDTAHSMLLLDEVDSLLRDRRQARHSWEATQVNELLQQMERFGGIFIAATNLIGQLDAAAMRCFNFKLQFRTLEHTQRRSLFAREALGDARRVGEIAPALGARLDALDMLTQGDFANVVRQRDLLGDTPSPKDFLRRLIVECRHKEGMQAAA